MSANLLTDHERATAARLEKLASASRGRGPRARFARQDLERELSQIRRVDSLLASLPSESWPAAFDRLCDLVNERPELLLTVGYDADLRREIEAVALLDAD